jgi:hypothetical protein
MRPTLIIPQTFHYNSTLMRTAKAVPVHTMKENKGMDVQLREFLSSLADFGE